MFIQLKILKRFAGTSAIGYESLDMENNVNIQFVRRNSLFAFDNISVERTTNFKIPATGNNIRILDFGNSYYKQQDAGDIDRLIVDATMVINMMQLQGYLYITKYNFDSKDFDAVFVSGELLALKRLKDAGKISELIQTDAWLPFGYTNFDFKDYWRSDTSAFDGVNRPSYNLNWVLEQLKTIVGFNCEELPTNLDVIIPEPDVAKEIDFSVTQAVIGELDSDTPYNTISVTSAKGADLFFETSGTAKGRLWFKRLTDTVYYMACGMTAKANVSILFPSDFSDDIMGIIWNGIPEQPTLEITYLGDYGLSTENNVLEVVGEPLKGRSVNLDKGWSLIFVNKNDYLYDEWGNSIFLPLISVTNVDGLKMSVNGDPIENAPLFLRDNLDDMTITDVLKIYAYATGKVLRYEDNQVYFDDLDFSNSPIVEIKNATKRSNLKKTFSDYAQLNRVYFESDDDVLPSAQLQVDYTLPNKTIKAEKDLYVFPFSEGMMGVDRLYISERATERILGVPISINNIGATTKMTLPMNDNLQSILNNSVSISVQAAMSLFEYNTIKEKTILYFDGCHWLWTDAKWSKGIATFSLSKIE